MENFVFSKDCVFENQGGGVRRRILAHGDALMQVEVHFETNAEGAVHRHPHTQTTYVLKGTFEFTVDGESAIVCGGDTVYMPSQTLHGCKCLEKGVLLDVFSPQREDFLK